MKTLNLTSTQNRKSTLSKTNLSNINFVNRLPKQLIEILYFEQLNKILIDLNIKNVVVEYKSNKVWRKQDGKFIDADLDYTISINNKVLHSYVLYSINNQVNFLSTKTENEVKQFLKYTIVWSLFGDHYTGNNFLESLNEVQLLKVSLLRCQRELFLKTNSLNTIQKQIIKVVPLNGVHAGTKLNNFLKRKSLFKLV